MKIAIIGYSGSGKSTLARCLRKVYKISLLHLDQVQFLPQWQERDRVESQQIVARFMKKPAWIIEGNYSFMHFNKRIEQSDLIIFLDFHPIASLLAVGERYISNKNRVRMDMAPGCIEKIDWEFLRWIIYDGRTQEKKRGYRTIIHTFGSKTITLHNRAELSLFLETIQKSRVGHQIL